MAPPIITVAVNGAPVRFLGSPLNDGREDLPWVEVDDLLLSYGRYNQGWEILNDYPFQPGGVDIYLVPTGGYATIIPDALAQVLLSSLTRLDGVDRLADYRAAAGQAARVMLSNLPPERASSFLAAAARRW